MVGKAVFLVVALLLMAQVSLAAENSLVITLIYGSAIVEHSFNLSETKDVKIILPLDAEVAAIDEKAGLKAVRAEKARAEASEKIRTEKEVTAKWTGRTDVESGKPEVEKGSKGKAK
ncbi:MAG TPA: hypothetical protein VJI75_01485 [Candidatus Nanoarchaeia archaeon]|nr:hypothetical protein [Candidatus Nanoarchaeia archaeon]